ncbi:hypothetical protein MKW94_028118 [Papaver nudicaule]|uniref:Uncharacterized protein n=1 Tax=Papaver nudicaule TaxID=74823 RepID=A0AA41S7T9_PAPNU|nr:hypothetical protein [Papaver nudicaule]
MYSVDFEEAGHKLVKLGFSQYGLLRQIFCMISRVHQENFGNYIMLYLGHVLAYIGLSLDRGGCYFLFTIFIKILFQRLTEPSMRDSFESFFARYNPKNTRYSINFFMSIGLGGITENLCE